MCYKQCGSSFRVNRAHSAKATKISDVWHVSSASAIKRIDAQTLDLKLAASVLFLRTNARRTRPSHSSKLIGGGGLRGTIRTTDDSTCALKRNSQRWPRDQFRTCRYLWRRSKIVLAHLHDVVHTSQQLGVHRQATVQRVAGFRNCHSPGKER